MACQFSRLFSAPFRIQGPFLILNSKIANCSTFNGFKMPIAFTRCSSALHRVVSRSAYSPCAVRPYSSYVFQGQPLQSPLKFPFPHPPHPTTFSTLY